jgi:hypothetical protein
MWVGFIFRACRLISAYSSRSELLDHLLKNGKHLWYGDSGRVKRWIILIGSGQRDRQLKLRTTFSTGKKYLSSHVQILDCILVLASDMVCESSLAETASSSCPVTSLDRPL